MSLAKSLCSCPFSYNLLQNVQYPNSRTEVGPSYLASLEEEEVGKEGTTKVNAFP